jgi:hypothetical protein
LKKRTKKLLSVLGGSKFSRLGREQFDCCYTNRREERLVEKDRGLPSPVELRGGWY